MAKNVFISFRFSDGHQYKERLVRLFDSNTDTVDFSEDEDRSCFSEVTIRNYLYAKLRRASITIVLLTPNAVQHRKNWFGQYDDWMYDEIRYSLENRNNNRTNGLIAVYTPEAESYIITRNAGSSVLSINNVDNLFRHNMMNVKANYKMNPTPGVYNADYDSYCSLVSFDDFIRDPARYIDIATKKREETYKYDIVYRLQ